jgi:hypothetical protein
MPFYGMMPKNNNRMNKRWFKRGPRNTTRTSQISHFQTALLASTFPSINTSWSVFEPTNNIRLGTDYNARLGRYVYLEKIRVSGTLVGGQSNLSSDDSRNVVRIVVAITGDAFTSSSLSGLSLSSPITNMNVTGLLRVLQDRTVNLRVFGSDSVGYVPSQQLLDMVIPVSQNVIYNDSVGGFSPVPQINIFVISDSSLSPSPGFVSGYIQTFFRSQRI